ncbi:putative RDD family membrane protein YckC [Elusimicrobium posterum]|uniref:RDD family protein n=1 Tax=Elusimicrobium posterum TaxID=3116653 RepID=UPI003C751D19
MQYSNPWKRLAAFLIDAIIISIPASIFMVILMTVMMNSNQELINQFQYAVQTNTEPSPEMIKGFVSAFLQLQLYYMAAYSLMWWLYNALLESSKWQATLGKKMLGMIVVDAEGQKISFLRASGRWLGKYISQTLWPVLFAIFFTEKKQALHDMPVKTFVIDEVK